MIGQCKIMYIYLVSPDYGYRKGPLYSFSFDMAVVEKLNCKVRFAATEGFGGDNYKTVGSSRSVGLSSLGETPWQAMSNIHAAIKTGFTQPLPLVFRSQVADETYIHNLTLSDQ